MCMVGWKETGVAIMKKKWYADASKKLKTELAYDRVILLLDICPKEMNLAC